MEDEQDKEFQQLAKNRKIAQQKFKRWIEQGDGPWCMQHLKEKFKFEGPTFCLGENETIGDMGFKEGCKQTIEYMIVTAKPIQKVNTDD